TPVGARARGVARVSPAAKGGAAPGIGRIVPRHPGRAAALGRARTPHTPVAGSFNGAAHASPAAIPPPPGTTFDTAAPAPPSPPPTLARTLLAASLHPPHPRLSRFSALFRRRHPFPRCTARVI